MISISLLVLLSCMACCQATITLTATGQHFASRPDDTVGTRFLQGFEYLARLQVFSHDLELCPSSDEHEHLNLTVDVPPDGLPVAILARNTGCSVEQKARLASYSVQPPHKLKYLILYGDEGLLPEQEDEAPYMVMQGHGKHGNGRIKRQRDLDITVGVLHVSERSGNELLWTITNQSQESKLAGGPRVLLDGHDASRSKFARDFTLWMGVGVMSMACMFSFFLSIRAQQGAFRSGPIEPPRRQAPRRLTQEQVQELPEFTAREYLSQVVVEEEAHHHDFPEICSICLDEYAPDDVLGELPCGHVFHRDCIGKWLTERSSTCPLCKTDLLPNEDDDDDASDYVELRDGESHSSGDSDDSVQLGIFSMMDRAFARVRSRWSRRRRQQDGTDETGVSQQPLLHNDNDNDVVESFDEEGSQSSANV